MDSTTLMVVGAGVLALIVVVVLIALQRSWGDFPSRAGALPPTGASAPGHSDQPVVRQHSPAYDTLAAQDTLVPIEHPLVRRAAERALAEGGAPARYIVRQGGNLYFTFEQINDPAQRQEAYDLLRRLNAGEHVDVRAAMQLVRQLFKS